MRRVTVKTTREAIPRPAICAMGNMPMDISRMASIANERGLTMAIALSHGGMASYGIRALDVKNRGMDIMALSELYESYSPRCSATVVEIPEKVKPNRQRTQNTRR